MAPRPTKRHLPQPGQIALPLRVPRLVVGPMLSLDDRLELDHAAACECEREPYRWRPGDPVVRFGA